MTRGLAHRVASRVASRILGVAKGRRRLADDVSVSQFLQRLNERGCRYAVLRWFETLPDVADGEDIDVLVSDEDAEFLLSMLTTAGQGPGTPCDPYSVSGLPGSAFRGIPYFPPKISERILGRAVRHESGAMVPCPEDHFYSMAFHALYHKGAPSGVPPRAGEPAFRGDPEHDYTATLTRLAADIGVDVSCDMEALDRLLDAQGWRPPLDMMAKLGERNEWCRARAHEAMQQWIEVPGLAAFVVRDVAAGSDDLAWVVRLLEEEGFDVLVTQRLDPASRDRVAHTIRGGTWTRGPFPTSGGEPAAVVMAVDVFPEAPSDSLRRQHPLADNGRVFRAKLRVRNEFNARRPENERCNAIHASDNARHAAHYLAVASPEAMQQVLAEAERRRADVPKHDDTVVANLSNYSRRARVELVQSASGQRCVRKTFRPGRERFLERELHAMRSLRAHDPFDVVPPLLASTALSYTIPYYENLLDLGPRRREGEPRPLIPTDVAARAFRAAKHFHEAGFVFLDFAPHNLIVDATQGLKFIDFEFVYEVRPPAETFEKSRTVLGPTNDWEGDVPVAIQGHWYERHWRPVTGLTLEQLLNGTPPRQRIARSVYVAQSHAKWQARLARSVVDKVRRVLEGRRP